MISIDAFNKIGRPMTVSRLLYEKPEGRLYKILLVLLFVLGAGSVSLILLAFREMFTIWFDIELNQNHVHFGEICWRCFFG